MGNDKSHDHIETRAWEDSRCRDCKWLDLTDKTSIGYKCVCPNIQHKGGGCRKYRHSKACSKGFEAKELDPCEILLKRCPFCGSKAEILIINNSYGDRAEGHAALVRCSYFGCLVKPKTSYFGTDREAVDAWNGRDKRAVREG